MAAFSGFYESHEPPPSGDARGIVPPHHDGHQNGQQSGYIFHYCCVDCCPGGRRGNMERVVARWQHLVATMKALLDLIHLATNAVLGLQRRCFRLLSPSFWPGIIVSKDHVMVHLTA